MERTKSLGAGQLVVAVYAVFALSASARAGYQLFTKFNEAPLAYSLSALSAVVYIVATISLASKSKRALRIAKATILFELIGVLLIGTLSFIEPNWFGHATVWSQFGAGYAYIPLLLPVIGLVWLNGRKR